MNCHVSQENYINYLSERRFLLLGSAAQIVVILSVVRFASAPNLRGELQFFWVSDMLQIYMIQHLTFYCYLFMCYIYRHLDFKLVIILLHIQEGPFDVHW